MGCVVTRTVGFGPWGQEEEQRLIIIVSPFKMIKQKYEKLACFLQYLLIIPTFKILASKTIYEELNLKISFVCMILNITVCNLIKINASVLFNRIMR